MMLSAYIPPGTMVEIDEIYRVTLHFKNPDDAIILFETLRELTRGGRDTPKEPGGES